MYVSLVAVSPFQQLRKGVSTCDKAGPAVATARQTLQPLEGTVLHPHAGLLALLPKGIGFRSDIGNGPIPLQGQTD